MISEMLDKIADSLEAKGALKEAAEIDVIANTIEAFEQGGIVPLRERIKGLKQPVAPAQLAQAPQAPAGIVPLRQRMKAQAPAPQQKTGPAWQQAKSPAPQQPVTQKPAAPQQSEEQIREMLRSKIPQFRGISGSENQMEYDRKKQEWQWRHQREVNNWKMGDPYPLWYQQAMQKPSLYEEQLREHLRLHPGSMGQLAPGRDPGEGLGSKTERDVWAMLDDIADSLEAKGAFKEAAEIDVISNTIEAAWYGNLHYRDVKQLSEEQLESEKKSLQRELKGMLGDIPDSRNLAGPDFLTRSMAHQHESHTGDIRKRIDEIDKELARKEKARIDALGTMYPSSMPGPTHRSWSSY